MNRQRYAVLGVLVDAVEMRTAVSRVVHAATERIALGVSALAVHGVMTAVTDPELQYRLNSLELVVPDGQPVRWALGWLHGTRLQERVYGPDLMHHVCAQAAVQQLPIYLYGSTEETLQVLRESLVAKHPGLHVAGSQPSRFRSADDAERQADLDRISQSGARIVFVGLGCPRQEIWTYENRLDLSLPVLAVGAAFDYHAGRLTRPPSWVQRRGLEWMYRLLQEPRRLWRRYLLLNPAYLTLVACQRLGVWRIATRRAAAPARPLRPG